MIVEEFYYVSFPFHQLSSLLFLSLTLFVFYFSLSELLNQIFSSLIFHLSSFIYKLIRLFISEDYFSCILHILICKYFLPYIMFSSLIYELFMNVFISKYKVFQVIFLLLISSSTALRF